MTSRYWRKLVDGEPALPKILELPLLTHTHEWGPLYQRHISDYENPHKVKDVFKQLFLEKHYWEVHSEAYKAILQALTEHIVNFDAHPEIWQPIIEEFEQHTHPDPKPLVDFDTDTPEPGQLFRNSQGLFGLQGNLIPVFLGSEGQKTFSELLVESGLIPRDALKELTNPRYTVGARKKNTVSNPWVILNKVESANYIEQLASLTEELFAGSNALVGFTKAELAELGIRLLELYVDKKSYYDFHTYMKDFFVDFDKVTWNIKHIYECLLPKGGFDLAYSFSECIPLTGTNIPSLRRIGYIQDLFDNDYYFFGKSVLRVCGGDYLYQLNTRTLVQLTSAIFTYRTANMEYKPTIFHSLVVRDSSPPGLGWLVTTTSEPTTSIEALKNFEDYFQKNGMVPPATYAYKAANASIIEGSNIASELIGVYTSEKYDWLGPRNISFFKTGKVESPYKDFAKTNPVTAGKERSILTSVQRGLYFLETQQLASKQWSEVFFEVFLSKVGKLSSEEISNYRARVEQILGTDIQNKTFLEVYLELYKRVATLPPDKYRKISILLALLEAKNARWVSSGTYLLTSLNKFWSYGKLGGNIHFEVDKRLEDYDDIDEVEEPNLYLFLQPQTPKGFLYSFLLLLVLLEVVENKTTPRTPILKSEENGGHWLVFVNNIHPDFILLNERQFILSVIPNNSILFQITQEWNKLKQFSKAPIFNQKVLTLNWWKSHQYFMWPRVDIFSDLLNQATPKIREFPIFSSEDADYLDIDSAIFTVSPLGGTSKSRNIIAPFVSYAINFSFYGDYIDEDIFFYSPEIYYVDYPDTDGHFFTIPRVGIHPTGASHLVHFIIQTTYYCDQIRKGKIQLETAIENILDFLGDVYPFNYLPKKEIDVLLKKLKNEITQNATDRCSQQSAESITEYVYQVYRIPVVKDELEPEDLQGLVIDIPFTSYDSLAQFMPSRQKLKFQNGDTIDIVNTVFTQTLILGSNITELVKWESPIGRDIGYILYELLQLDSLVEGPSIYFRSNPLEDARYIPIFEEDLWKISAGTQLQFIPILASSTGTPNVTAYKHLFRSTDAMSAFTLALVTRLYDVTINKWEIENIFAPLPMVSFLNIPTLWPFVSKAGVNSYAYYDEINSKFSFETLHVDLIHGTLSEFAGGNISRRSNQIYLEIPAVILSSSLNNWLYFFLKVYRNKVDKPLYGIAETNRKVAAPDYLASKDFLIFTRTIFPELGLPLAHVVYFAIRGRLEVEKLPYLQQFSSEASYFNNPELYFEKMREKFTAFMPPFCSLEIETENEWYIKSMKTSCDPNKADKESLEQCKTGKVHPEELQNWEYILNPFRGKQIEAGKIQPYLAYTNAAYSPFSIFDTLYL